MVPRRSSRIVATAGTNGTVKSSTTAAKVKNEAKSLKGKRSRPSKSEDQAATLDAPSTPKRRRNDATIGKTTPAKSTPAAIALMTVPYSTGDIDDATPPPPAMRLAAPHRTNAPLISPETSRRVNNSNETMDSSPSKTPFSRPTTTTQDLLKDGCAHLLKMDPKLKRVIDQNPCSIFSPEGLAEEIDPFRSLVSGIIGQQVSGAAAKSIKNKFVALFNNDSTLSSHVFPTPSEVIASDLPTLRTAGLSQRKAEYIYGLAEKFASGELSAEMLLKASDEEVLEKLVAVRGLGKWSVEMFACFGLKRMDVFSTGDLGVQRGMAAYMGKDVSKLKAKGGGKWKYMSEKEMLDISAKFSPYRSLFMWYMWRIENVNVDVMQNGS